MKKQEKRFNVEKNEDNQEKQKEKIMEPILIA